MENVQDIFSISSLSSNSSSTPVALAHEQWGIWKRFYHSIMRHLMGCISLCTWECRKVVGRWNFLAPSYFASGQDAICNADSCKWPSGSSNTVVQRRVLVFWAIAYPAQWNYRDDVRTWHNGSRGDYGSRGTSSRSWLAARQPLQVKFFSSTFGGVLHCCSLHSARNRNSVLCH